jgi:Nif-specific regulatory protein
MANFAGEKINHIEELNNLLLSTLDEGVFFSNLSSFLNSALNIESVKAYLVQEDQSAKLISKQGLSVENGHELIIGQGSAGHVIRTKKAYFSNNVSRDPIFHQEAAEGVKAEMAVPVIFEDSILATIHFQNKNSDKQFSREDVLTINQLLQKVEKPLANLKLYLTAKNLNSILLKKIEEKESELKKRSFAISSESSVSIQEPNLIGKSESFQTALRLARKVSQSDVMVLIEGFSGTGKESIARRIHLDSLRKQNAYVSFDCSSIADTKSLEIEIFGSKGVEILSGRPDQSGALERANGGTLVLKRIECLPMNLQSKLLTFIKEGTALKVGDHVPYRSNVRVIAISNDSLQSRIADGKFRDDLYYILNTISLKMPNLTERSDDIETLANYFLNFGKEIKDQKTLSPCVISALKEYKWPGNIRELQNIIERAYILSDGMIIDRSHLADHILHVEKEETTTVVEVTSYAPKTLEELEKKHICDTLDYLSGNKTKSAKVLGITVKTLYNKLHSYGMIEAKEGEI